MKSSSLSFDERTRQLGTYFRTSDWSLDVVPEFPPIPELLNSFCKEEGSTASYRSPKSEEISVNGNTLLDFFSHKLY